MPQPTLSRLLLAADSNHLADVHERIRRLMLMGANAPEAGRGGDAIGHKPVAGVAVMPVHGVIIDRGPRWWMDYGVCICDHWGREFDATVADESVTGIVLDVDSPGGTVAGVQEIGDRVFAARTKKPVIAIANHMMASAAYWIGSASSRVYATQNAQVGSIGVYSMHIDYSKMMEEEGIKVTIFRAGQNKAEFNPYEPVSEDAAKFEQKTVETLKGNFVRHVGLHRARSVEEVDSEKWGQGRLFMAHEAKSIGMVDRITSLEELVARVAKGRIRIGEGGMLVEDWSSMEQGESELEHLRLMLGLRQRQLTMKP